MPGADALQSVGAEHRSDVSCQCWRRSESTPAQHGRRRITMNASVEARPGEVGDQALMRGLDTA
jgi:hypothetical protein